MKSFWLRKLQNLIQVLSYVGHVWTFLCSGTFPVTEKAERQLLFLQNSSQRSVCLSIFWYVCMFGCGYLDLFLWMSTSAVSSHLRLTLALSVSFLRLNQLLHFLPTFHCVFLFSPWFHILSFILPSRPAYCCDNLKLFVWEDKEASVKVCFLRSCYICLSSRSQETTTWMELERA